MVACAFVQEKSSVFFTPKNQHPQQTRAVLDGKEVLGAMSALAGGDMRSRLTFGRKHQGLLPGEEI